MSKQVPWITPDFLLVVSLGMSFPKNPKFDGNLLHILQIYLYFPGSI